MFKKSYRIVQDGKWYKGEVKHWFFGWEYVASSVDYSQAKCKENILNGIIRQKDTDVLEEFEI